MKLKKFFPFLLILGVTTWVVSNKLTVKPDDYVPHATEESIFEELFPELKTLAKKDGGITEEFDANSFEFFLENMGNRAFHHQQSTLLDTTGDGKKEMVRSSVRIENGYCLVKNEIDKNGVLIWEDEFTFNRDFLSGIYPDISIEKYDEYLLFFHGLQYTTFVEQWPESKSKEDYFLGMIRMNDSLDERIVLENITNHSGLFVFDLNQGVPGIHAWNKTTGTFERIISKEPKIVS